MYVSFCKYLILRYYAKWLRVSGKISGLKQGIEMTIFVLKRSSSPRSTVALSILNGLNMQHLLLFLGLRVLFVLNHLLLHLLRSPITDHV